jgi:predicted regulator of Ras-like GTPase activity (Roadblock/LC7/MglB family)
MGTRVIRGEAARQLLAQYEFIHASLRQYTDREFQEALTLVGPGARITGRGEEAAELPPFMKMFEERQGAGGVSKSRSAGPVAGHHDPVEDEPAAGKSGRTGAAVPPLRVKEHTSRGILDRIVYIPGVSAAAIFREGSIVDSRGDDSLEDLVEPAEEVLLSVFEVLALLSTGPLVQVTIRLFGRNVTIAPFNDGYLLVLTNPEVNLGQIRKLVHDVTEIGMV